jgi:formiminotetrahydrofolate cyclodeaminase
MDGPPPKNSAAASQPPDATYPISAFLDALAAKQPIPGGGAVAALAGALAAAMGEMVLNYSVGKKELAPHQEELDSLLHQLHNARWMLTQLLIEDQLAFAALAAERKTQKSSPKQSHPTLDSALLACIAVPQAVGATALAILGAAQRALPIANRHLLSDLAVCAELAMATLRCAAYNVRINLADVADPARRLDLRYSAEKMIVSGTDLIRELMPAVWQRIGQGEQEQAAKKP